MRNDEGFEVRYISDAVDAVVGKYATKQEAKEAILRMQLNPNSFYEAMYDKSEHEVSRIENHKIVIQDSEGRVVYGEGGHCKISTLGVTDAEQPEIPEGCVPIFTSEYGFDALNDCSSEIISSLRHGNDVLFYVDKKELDNALDTFFSTDTGHAFSHMKAKSLKSILESRFYSSYRDYSDPSKGNLEKDAVGEISSVIAFHFRGSTDHVKIFEDTEKNLLTHALLSRFSDEIGQVVEANNKHELDIFLKSYNSIADSYADRFNDAVFDEEINRVIDAKIEKQRDEELVVEPVSYITLTASDIENIVEIHKEIQEAFAVARVARDEFSASSSNAVDQSSQMLEELLDSKAHGLSPKQIGSAIASAIESKKLDGELKEKAAEVKNTVSRGTKLK